MHDRDGYNDQQAKNIYEHVLAFMQCLVRGGLTE